MESSHSDIHFPSIHQSMRSKPCTDSPSKSDVGSIDQSSTEQFASTICSSSTTSSKTVHSLTGVIREWHNHRKRLSHLLHTDHNQNAKSFQVSRVNRQSLPTSPTNRPYDEVVARLKNSQNRARFTDFISRERNQRPRAKHTAFNNFYKIDMESLKNEMRETLDAELKETETSPLAIEIDEELQRKDFEEFIMLQSTGPSEMGHLYFKIIKIFRYVSITNVQGTLIALLSLNRLIKRSPEVVQAVEESDGIALLLNLLECHIVSIQLAAMKLLSSLFKVMYLRRMAIAYGAVQVLVELLLESDDNIQVMTSDLLSNLALLREARQIIPKTKGIQHLVCLLNMTTTRTENSDRLCEKQARPNSANSVDRRHSLVNEEESRAAEDMARGERVLVSVATALWRFSRSPINRRIMQRAGLVLTLVRLIRMKSEKILVPVLGILQGCATDAAFRLSIRTEGILKFLIQHLRFMDAQVKLQCARTLYHCADDEKSKVLIRTLGGLSALTSNLKNQTSEAAKLLQSGWVDSNSLIAVEISPTGRYSNKEERNNSLPVTQSPTDPKQPEIRIGRLRMSGHSVNRGRPTTPGSRGELEEADESITFQLLHTLLATIGKCSSLEANLIALDDLGATDCMIKLLHILPPYLMVYRQPSCAVSPRLQKVNLLERVCALNIHCLSLVGRLHAVQVQLAFCSSTLNSLVELLSHGSPEILVPTINAIASLVAYPNLMQTINNQNGFRYLFSSCFHNDVQVRMAALLAVQAFLKVAPSRSALLRPIRSSLGQLVQALNMEYTNLLALKNKAEPEKEQLLSALCSVLAEIATEEQGRAVLIELGVVPFLANITTSAKEDCLQIGVCDAIAQFGYSEVVLKAFRNQEVLNALVEFVRMGSPALKVSAARALDVLTADSVICARVRALDVTSALLHIMCDGPQELQTAAAHVIGRVARLSLSHSRSRLKH